MIKSNLSTTDGLSQVIKTLSDKDLAAFDKKINQLEKAKLSYKKQVQELLEAKSIVKAKAEAAKMARRTRINNKNSVV